MLLIILISTIFEINATPIKSLIPSTCRTNKDCSIFGPEYVCDMYQRVCENPWDLGRQCLQDYDCPRGYACEQFCKSKDTVEASGNSTWTPWRPWENTSISRRRCFNSLKFCKKVDTLQAILKLEYGLRSNRPPKGSGSSHRPSKGSCYYDDDCASASNQMSGCYHPNAPPPYDPVHPCPQPYGYPPPQSYPRPRPLDQRGICGPVWGGACMQDWNCPDGFRCRQKYKYKHKETENECFDTKFCRYQKRPWFG